MKVTLRQLMSNVHHSTTCNAKRSTRVRTIGFCLGRALYCASELFSTYAFHLYYIWHGSAFPRLARHRRNRSCRSSFQRLEVRLRISVIGVCNTVSSTSTYFENGDIPFPSVNMYCLIFATRCLISLKLIFISNRTLSFVLAPPLIAASTT